jgi:single-stranded DNA-binding protein
LSAPLSATAYKLIDEIVITAWGRQAGLAAEYLAKGRQVYVERRLRRGQYTDRDGNPRTNLEVNASDIQFLGNAPILLSGARRSIHHQSSAHHRHRSH